MPAPRRSRSQPADSELILDPARWDTYAPIPAPAPVAPTPGGINPLALDYHRSLIRYRDERSMWVTGERVRQRTAGVPVNSPEVLKARYTDLVRPPPMPEGLSSSVAQALHNTVLGARGDEEPEPEPTPTILPEPSPKFNYKRGEATPPFFINYATADEYQLRLRGSYILYKGSPALVHAVTTNRREVILVLRFDSSGNSFHVPVNENLGVLDSRPMAPGYVKVPSWKKGCGYLQRLPARQQRQGNCGENTFVAIPGGSLDTSATYNLGRFRIEEAIEVLADQSEQPFHPSLIKDFPGLIADGNTPSVKLSRNFAVIGNQAGVHLGFRNVPVGSILNNKMPNLSELPLSMKDECQRLNLI